MSVAFRGEMRGVLLLRIFGNTTPCLIPFAVMSHNVALETNLNIKDSLISIFSMMCE